VLVAVVGTTGLEPALAALAAGKDLALASKEILVLAGKFIMAEAQRRGAKLLPVDSEHNAVFQCLEGHPHGGVRRIVLTASGRALSHRSTSPGWSVWSSRRWMKGVSPCCGWPGRPWRPGASRRPY